jgi:predicted acylesterase/phospholipase RssA
MTSHSGYAAAIVLQGGGALGAYEYGVLKALYETRPGFRPAVVTGVSIGAITAAVLVGAANQIARMANQGGLSRRDRTENRRTETGKCDDGGDQGEKKASRVTGERADHRRD